VTPPGFVTGSSERDGGGKGPREKRGREVIVVLKWCSETRPRLECTTSLVKGKSMVPNQEKTTDASGTSLVKEEGQR